MALWWHHTYISELVRVMAWCLTAHYLNQSWIFCNWTLGNKLCWNLNQNAYFSHSRKCTGNALCKIPAILFRAQCVEDSQMNHSTKQKWELLFKWVWLLQQGTRQISQVWHYVNNKTAFIASKVILIVVWNMAISVESIHCILWTKLCILMFSTGSVNWKGI